MEKHGFRCIFSIFISLIIILTSNINVTFAEKKVLIEDSDSDFFDSTDDDFDTFLGLYGSPNNRTNKTKLPKVSILSGAYKKIKKQKYDHKTFEVHHIITRYALKILSAAARYLNQENDSITFYQDTDWAPCILLEHNDHLEIPSSRDRTLEYHRNQALDILENGNYNEIIHQEIEFIDQRLNYNHRYDNALNQLRRYIRQLNIRNNGSFVSININGHTEYLPIVQLSLTSMFN